MILLLLLLGLRLSMACHGDDIHIDCDGDAECKFNAAAPSGNHSEALCSTLRTLGQSLEDVLMHGGCVDSESRGKHKHYLQSLLPICFS